MGIGKGKLLKKITHRIHGMQEYSRTSAYDKIRRSINVPYVISMDIIIQAHTICSITL